MMTGFIGQAVAFAALVAGATVLEMNGKDADGLWVLVVLWVVFGRWTPKSEMLE